MSQTREQKRFTIDVAADWHELMIPQRTMRSSIARVGEQLDLRFAASRHTTAPISHRLSSRSLYRLLLISRPAEGRRLSSSHPLSFRGPLRPPPLTTPLTAGHTQTDRQTDRHRAVMSINVMSTAYNRCLPPNPLPSNRSHVYSNGTAAISDER